MESGSAAFLDVKGKQGKMKSTGDDRFYFVLEGNGKFVLDGKEISAEKEDLIIVPKNTIYDFQVENTTYSVYYTSIRPKK